MRLQRMEVEGGFLDGLDLPLEPGLNVLIGERGTGKTSVIELLRYVLASGALTTSAAAVHEERARSVLGDGIVTVSLIDDSGQTLAASRTFRDDAPRGLPTLPVTTIVGQGEMEAIGVDSGSRLRLLDRYAGVDDNQERATATSALADIRSKTQQLSRLRRELQSVEEQLAELTDVPEQLRAASEAQAESLASAKASEEQSRLLTTLQSQVEGVRASLAHLTESQARIASNTALLDNVLGQWRPLADTGVEALGKDPAANARPMIERATQLVEQARSALSVASAEMQKASREREARLVELDARTKQLRNELGSLREGVTAAARKVDALREQSGMRNALLHRREELMAEIARVARERRNVYAEVDHMRSTRLDRRSQVAANLTSRHGPELHVTVSGTADRSPFSAEIVKALTGTGLHYNVLSPKLAEQVSPLELVECAESLDYERLATLTDFPSDRCAQILSALTPQDLSKIALSPLEDVVNIALLDGADYKPMARLSIGQRCTTILPIVLGARADILALDQPEDNLDNAFVSTTIVPAIMRRSHASQVIIATHNPNIPVLGEAANVVHLASDGSRGFIESAAPLAANESRGAITGIMEGGKEAFRTRWAFYALDDHA